MGTHVVDEDGYVWLELEMPCDQLDEIYKRAGIEPIDVEAFNEYVVGSALGERHEALLQHVHAVAKANRAQLPDMDSPAS